MFIRKIISEEKSLTRTMDTLSLALADELSGLNGYQGDFLDASFLVIGNLLTNNCEFHSYVSNTTYLEDGELMIDQHEGFIALGGNTDSLEISMANSFDSEVPLIHVQNLYPNGNDYWDYLTSSQINLLVLWSYASEQLHASFKIDIIRFKLKLDQHSVSPR